MLAVDMFEADIHFVKFKFERDISMRDEAAGADILMAGQRALEISRESLLHVMGH